jgi:hypothetical protein
MRSALLGAALAAGTLVLVAITPTRVGDRAETGRQLHTSYGLRNAGSAHQLSTKLGFGLGHTLLQRTRLVGHESE